MSYMLPETAWNPLPLLPTDTYLTHTAATERAAAEGTFPPHDVIMTIIHRQGRADETKQGLEGEV